MVKNRKNKNTESSKTDRPKDEIEASQIKNTRAEFIKSQLNNPKPPTKVIVPTPVIVKIFLFSLALIILPIWSYYFSLNRFFNGNSVYSAMLAAGVANAVAIGYVIAAILEDQQTSNESTTTETKKSK